MSRFLPLSGLLAAVLLLGPPAAAQSSNFEGIVTHVTDGDSLWIKPAAGGAPVEVRLQGIDAPEICQAFGPQAREALAKRLLHRRVVVSSDARDDYQRTLSRVTLEGRDIGAWMVRRGYAWSYQFRRNRGPYAWDEMKARRARLGLWADGEPMEPRVFRKRHGSCV